MNVTTRRAFRSVAVSALASVFLLAGCTEEKKATPVQEPAKQQQAQTPPPTPPAPPKPAEQRAQKECAAPIDLTPPQDLKVGERAAKLAGYKLSFADKDADGQLVLGVVGPLNEDSGENLVNIKKYVKFFQDEKADAIVVTGDIGEVHADGVARNLIALAESKLPVFTIIGNRECAAAFTDGVAQAQKTAPNVVNMNQVRAVEFPEATLVSLPGHHDVNYISCKTGCQWFPSTVDEVIRVSKESKAPVVLISHGPPRGSGSQALDVASGGGNVGAEDVNRAIKEGNISFGVFSNIKEAGGRAVDSAEGTTLVAEGKASKKLFLNPGPADSVGWDMNDNTKSNGMVATLKIKGDEGTWKIFRAKALTKAEKEEAKKLAPPRREEPTAEAEEPAPAGTPAPPPGQPAQQAEPNKP